MSLPAAGAAGLPATPVSSEPGVYCVDSKYMESTNQPTSQPTPPVLHVVLRKPFQEIKAFAEWAKEQTLNYLVGEHEADPEIETTHCHILLEGLKVTKEALRKQILKVSPGRGQYVIMEKTQKARLPYDRNYLGVYILKGKCATANATSFDDVQLALWASKWVDQSEEKLSKAEKETTIWDVIMTAHKKCKADWKLGSHNELNLVVEPSRENWYILCQELNRARIRTSRNELERAWVTLLRQDPHNQDDLFNSIMSNVFRK